MRVDEFDYHLPPELIAQKPLEPRHSSLLLAANCGDKTLEHLSFRDLPRFLGSGDCLVFNSSRVRRARLKGRKLNGGAQVELLLLRRGQGESWEALGRPARRLRPGVEIIFADGELHGKIIEKGERGELAVSLTTLEGEPVEDCIERIGEIPLPPYIKGETDDTERYQTVFASQLGSAAAPTAGLHFENEDLLAFEEMGVRLAFLRLDVGLDTFRPIEAECVEAHELHSEQVFLDEETCHTINASRKEGGRVIAVGTTVVRALEGSISGGEVAPFSGKTDLFIYPGHQFKVVDCLLTNFHLPRSSLLLLVCAFAGRDLVMEAYREAVSHRYRFLSFGDACFFHFPDGRYSQALNG